MSLIDKKRDELEQFIQEQMIGPGGCAGRFGKDGLDEQQEVLNTTPGNVYNTAILFPQKAEGVVIDEQQENDNQEENKAVSGESEDQTIDEKDQDSGNSDHDDNFSIERRFPNVMAISCCLNENVDLKRDVKIHITGRYYRKIEGDGRKNVYISIPENQCDILRNHLNSDEMIRESFNLNEERLYAKFYTSETASDISEHVEELNRKWSRVIRDIVHSKTWGKGLFENVKEEYLLLSVCRRKLFDKLKNRNTDSQSAKEIKELIDKIGQYEQSIQNLQDLIALYHGKNYGFWESIPVDWKMEDLSQIPFEEDRRTYTPENGCPSLKLVKDKYIRSFPNENHDIEMSLSVLLQVTKDNRNPANRNKYFKVMLKNSTTPFVETQDDHYTIVNEELNKSCFFGMKIELESEFLEPYTYKKEQGYQDVNKEEDRLKFLYRDVCDYGVGHLCSVNWEKENHKVWSEFLPTCDVPDVEFTPRNKRADWVQEVENDETHIVPPPFLNNDDCLSLHRLSTFSDVDDDNIRTGLQTFVGKYQEWINLLPDHSQGDAKYDDFAQYTKGQCQIDCNRMGENISIILGDDENLHIFRLMNSAMLMQMWHNKDNYGQVQLPIMPDFYSNKGTKYKWRPFQLAFILLNLDGIIQRSDDPQWDKRNEFVDLVWFPTGGGKTEAYLGIIALTIINRRRKYGNKAGGTTAIMRYTLRLLATQQFERALKLILALDQIRIWGNDAKYPNYNIGEEPVSIGLFVGKGSLPNTYDELNTMANNWNNSHVGTKIPLDKCPWCGEDLVWSSRCGGRRYRTGFPNQFNCSRNGCAFNKQRLPVQLCDDQIYADPPTLLFGTVDKFAQLARKVSTKHDSIENDSRRLFGVGDGIQYLTPDLIIQDELHLLLGPLGSAVSLFEAAIDQLCTRTNSENQEIEVRPKIISSTATTRNTELQIRALYDRGINIFPKSGVDHDDSFFAFYKRQRIGDKEEWVSKRRYKGIIPTGRTQMLMQLRLAAILFVHRAKFEKDHWQEGVNDEQYNSAANNYYSIISYFNSLKEVGKTDAQYPYEFTKYLQRLYLRVMGHCGLLDCFYADENTLSSEELTGRLSGPQVVATLDKVQRNFDVNHRLPHLDNNNVIVSGSTPPDYILATNMISVGIDVDRFNTIIMNSMPRNIAEYIQASSRVARKHKGLVLTSHNPYRVRDTSHYEKFIEFHEKMYYYVDPISITPFSNKAIEKYLPLYLATIIRHRFANLQNNRPRQNERPDANNIVNNAQQVIDNLKVYFKDRKNRTQGITNADSELETMLRNLLDDDMNQVIDRFIDDAIRQWEEMANGNTELWYYKDSQYLNGHNPLFLFSETEEYDDNRSDLWTVPNSLRIVEPEAVLKIQNLY